MKKLIFVRHGQSQANLDNIYGKFDSPLTKKGKEQAAAVGLKLGVMPDIIISSPQPRALETAQIIADVIEYTDDIVLSGDLIERKYGILEETEFLQDSDSLDVSADETAETLQDLYDRAANFYKQVQAMQEDVVLVTGHGAFGRALVRVIDGLSATTRLKPIGNAQPLVLVDK